MWFKSFALIFFVFVSEKNSVAQAQLSAEEAFQRASDNQKYVLLVFAGSDWCAPCISFEKKVLSQPDFNTFALNHLVILVADFPQRKTLSKVVQDQNEALAERYNPQGIFPNILLIKSDGTVVSTITYDSQSAKQFVSEIKQSLPDE
ncbi:MAG: thioredoxin family protein [Chryseolinea sp.]